MILSIARAKQKGIQNISHMRSGSQGECWERIRKCAGIWSITFDKTNRRYVDFLPRFIDKACPNKNNAMKKKKKQKEDEEISTVIRYTT